MDISGTDAPRRVVFQYLVPVHVEVEDGLVCRVTVIDETPVRHPTIVEGDGAYLDEAVRAADDGQPWPSWQFGY
ncbi:hypothetical protein [Brucella anthropi]|jgi:hypothetical protein|uniref:hypothetical protein n=1 Tax=Brucella anthropi TaxID=529 RepID=UPI00124D7342|nr:hypothetical protein [Brucella anthropi]KAB2748896.1 hypothetical protein F9L05_10550 [Brucella anthropi]